MNIAIMVEQIVEQRKLYPIDLLKNNDFQNECEYMDALKASWVRTIVDVVSLLPNGGRVLEIGSYYGVVAISLSQLGFDTVAFDMPDIQQHPKIVELYERYNVQIASEDLNNINQSPLDFENDSFDCVIMCEVLEHLNFNPLSVLRDIHRVIKPEGLFYLSVPNQVRLRNRYNCLVGRSIRNPVADFISLPDAAHHWREYTLKEVKEILAMADCNVVNDYYWSEKGKNLNLKSLIKILTKSIPSLRSNIIIMAKK
jgi:2-polyprenyl-3-methyl-5-hydroxy-6-metoxy-1,4-benzoquinol methylase